MKCPPAAQALLPTGSYGFLVFLHGSFCLYSNKRSYSLPLLSTLLYLSFFSYYHHHHIYHIYHIHHIHNHILTSGLLLSTSFPQLFNFSDLGHDCRILSTSSRPLFPIRHRRPGQSTHAWPSDSIWYWDHHLQLLSTSTFAGAKSISSYPTRPRTCRLASIPRSLYGNELLVTDDPGFDNNKYA
ncbi:hypothetical protein F4811DRAFT_67678 [Daldinia bambusicola]|nr:hypothetical protein F4811DRAFT_67678 [Daldinia bambusicola]